MRHAHDGYHRFHAADWHGLVRHGAGWLVSGDPLRRLLDRPHEEVKRRGGVATYRVESATGLLYVRHATELKATRDGRVRLSDRVKWLLRRSRAVRTLRVHLALEAAGVAVATITLAARRRRGLHVEDLLVTEAVPGENFIHHYNAIDDAAGKAELIGRVGRTVAALHRAGFVHGDMLPGNLLIRPAGELLFIDNERTRRPSPARLGALRRLNVAQMLSRFMPLNRYAALRPLLDGYYEAMGVGGEARRLEQARVVRRARRRRARIDAGHLADGRRLRRLDRREEQESRKAGKQET